MAAPTVRYFEVAAATDSALLVAWMSKLQELLLDAGWTVEYADSDAIGGGSGGTPAWDKTPATNVDAGIAVYRMPANDHATEWYVRIRPGWGANVANVGVRGIQVGTGHSGGTLSGTVSTETATVPGSTTKDRAWQMAVSEDGFVLSNPFATTAAMLVSVERLRDVGGAVTDTLGVLVRNATAAVAQRVINAVSGETVVATNLLQLVGAAFDTAASAYPSLSGQTGDVAAVGPFFYGGQPLWGLPRLWFLAGQADATASQYRTINVDGGDKVYRAGTVNIIAASIQTWVLVATE